MTTTLITGGAGFIGYHVARALLQAGDAVVTLDNLNDYYDPALKRMRLAELDRAGAHRFRLLDLCDRAALTSAFEETRPDRVVHLAAQAGVGYALKNPLAFSEANLAAFMNVIETCRTSGPGRLLYASSSSVYGGLDRYPFHEAQCLDRPLSIYAATKLANELAARSYHETFGFSSVGLRYFTVYGPWGRPDMAVWRFTECMHRGRPVTLHEGGRMERDFTYIDDIVAGTLAALDLKEGCLVINLGKGHPEKVTELLSVIERALGRKAEIVEAPKLPGEVQKTFADIRLAGQLLGYAPRTDLETGVGRFVEWYLEHGTRFSARG